MLVETISNDTTSKARIMFATKVKGQRPGVPVEITLVGIYDPGLNLACAVILFLSFRPSIRGPVDNQAKQIYGACECHCNSESCPPSTCLVPWQIYVDAGVDTWIICTPNMLVANKSSTEREASSVNIVTVCAFVMLRWLPLICTFDINYVYACVTRERHRVDYGYLGD